MRNLKKILAVICVVAMMASIAIVPALAAGFANETQATTLNTLGVMAGMNLGDEVTRIQGLTFAIKAAGKDAAAQALTQAEVDAALANVVDAKDIPAWGQKYAAYAVTTAMTTGVDASVAPKIKFAPLQAISGDSFLVWTLKSMGYTTVGTANAWETAVTDAKVLTLSQGYTIHGAAKLIRDDVAGILYGALDNGVCKDGKAFVDTLIAAGMFTQQAAADAGLTTPPAPVALAVDSVTATNLLKIVVKFNKDLNESVAETASNYTLSAGSIVSAVMQADKRTVVLQLNAAPANQTDLTLTIKNIKDSTGSTIADTSKDITLLDTTVPSALSALLVAPDKVKVTFSEPIDAVAGDLVTNYKIDSYTYSITDATVAADQESVTLTLGTALPTGAHTVTVNPETTGTLEDEAHFRLPKTALEFQAGTDTTAPTVSIKSNTETSVTLQFSEDMKAGSVNGNTGFIARHTYNSNVYQVNGTSISRTSDSEFVINFGTAKAFPVGTVNLYLSKDGGNDIEDAFGNHLALPLTLSFTNSIDTTAPTASVAFVDATHLDVTYSEGVTGATSIANYVLKNSGGTQLNVTGISAVAGVDNCYRLTTAQMSGGAYTLKISNIKDTSISANSMAATTLNFSCNDAVAPTVTATGKFSTDQKKIVVSFSEAMATSGANSVLDLSNYVLYDGATIKDWPSGTTAAPGIGNSVVITFTSAQAYLSAGDKVVVGRVADLNGNKTAAIATDVTLAGDTLAIANIRAAGVKAIARDTVTFEVDTPLTSLDITDFASCDGHPVTSVSYENKMVGANSDVNGAVVTVKVADANKWATDNAAATVVMNAGAMTTSLGTSNGAGITTTAAGDYMAPEISTVTTADNNNNGKIDHILVVYSEPLNVTSVDDNDYTVDGYTVTDVSYAGVTVTLTIDEVGFDTGAKPVVTQVGTVQDATANKNTLAAGAKDGDGTTDGAAPVLVDAIITSAGATAGYGNDVGDVIQLVFSEDVTLKAAYADTDAEADFDLSGTGTDGTNFTGDTFTVSGNTITATAAGAASVNVIATGNTIGIEAAIPAADITATPNTAAAGVTVR